MRATTTLPALCALLSVALSSPIDAAKNTLVRRNDEFMFWNEHHFQNTCIPGFCQNINQHDLKIEANCGTGVIDADPFGSYCDVEFKVCDRTLKLVKGVNSNDCRRLIDIKKEESGQGYAALNEGDKHIGTCYINMGESKIEPVFAGSVSSESQVKCIID